MKDGVIAAIAIVCAVFLAVGAMYVLRTSASTDTAAPSAMHR